MHCLIAAVGKARSGPEAALFAEYAKRLPWKLTLKECTGRTQAEECAALLAAAKPAERTVALDERGKALSSRELAELLTRWQEQGVRHIAFLIGGADGLTDEVRAEADMLISFGRLTWPHRLVRPMLAEQLYRAHTLMTGHPYHRGASS